MCERRRTFTPSIGTGQLTLRLLCEALCGSSFGHCWVLLLRHAIALHAARGADALSGGNTLATRRALAERRCKHRGGCRAVPAAFSRWWRCRASASLPKRCPSAIYCMPKLTILLRLHCCGLKQRLTKHCPGGSWPVGGSRQQGRFGCGWSWLVGCKAGRLCCFNTLLCQPKYDQARDQPARRQSWGPCSTLLYF